MSKVSSSRVSKLCLHRACTEPAQSLRDHGRPAGPIMKTATFRRQPFTG